jgi:hypothetical protein
MFIQSIGIWIILYSQAFPGWVTGLPLLGIGTTMVCPRLHVVISDISHPSWRATSLGVYRFWRGMGFVFVAIGIGFISDLFNMFIAIQVIACIGLDGLLVL